MVVLPLLDDGADVLTVDPEFEDDEFDDEALDDEFEVVADADEVLLDAELVLRPAYVCSASTPRPPTASTALATVEKSTRVRRRSARSRRATAVSGGVCEGGCEALLFMPLTLASRHVIPLHATWEAAEKTRDRSAGGGERAQVQRQLGEQLRARTVTGARDAIDRETLLGHLSSPPQAAPRRGSPVRCSASRNRRRTR